MKKGRKPKEPKPLPVEESDGEYTCSRCGVLFDRRAVAERHVLTEHYGLARLNDPNNEFDDREVMAAYKAAIRVLKSLRCLRCGKSFSSALGLKCHHDVCGFTDEELRRKCEVCGSMLKFRSLKSHMEIHKREEMQIVRTEADPTSSPAEGRPQRKSAKKANEFLKSNAEYDDSDFEYSRSGKKRRRRDSNVDFYLDDFDVDDTESTSSSCSTAADGGEPFGTSKSSLAMFKLNVSTERTFLLYKLWKDQIRTPAAITEKTNGYDESTGFKCDLCDQMFANHELLTFHYSKCDNSLDSNWSCGVCSFTAESDLVSLLRHMIERHIDQLADIPNQLYDSLMPKAEFKRPRSGSSAPPHVIEAEIFQRNHFGEPAFEDWPVDEQSICFLPESEQERYLPERKSSAKFRFKLVKGQKVVRSHKKSRGESQPEKEPENQLESQQESQESENNQENNQDNQENNQENEQNDWQQLNLFESVMSSTKQHTTIFTGGPVYSGAWCPYPPKTNQNQILCLATNVESRIFNVFDCHSQPGVLQFWNFGELKYNQNEKVSRWPEEEQTSSEDDSADGPSAKRPKLEFMIAHDYGTILEITWCPGGTTYLDAGELEDGVQQNGRLGLLALACSDGYVRILAIPLVEHLNRLAPDGQRKMFKCRPVAVLDKHPIGLSVHGKPTICKSLAWCPTNGQRQMAVGYGNGLISLFDLQTSASLLKRLSSSGVRQLKPRKTWIAHGAMISSLKWVPTSGCAYLVSASFDRHIKIWCLDDMGKFDPFNTYYKKVINLKIPPVTNITLAKRSVLTKVDWLPRYPGYFCSSDDCYSNLHNNVTYKDCTPSAYANSLSRHKSTVWDFNISSWANVQIGVDAAGEAILDVYVKPKNSKKHTKTRPFECVPAYRQTLEALDPSDLPEPTEQAVEQQSTPDENRAAPNLNYLIDSSRPMKATLDEMLDSYGIVFNEVDLVSFFYLSNSNPNSYF